MFDCNYIYCVFYNIIRLIKSRKIRWEGHVAPIGERRVAYKDLVGMLEGNKPLGRPWYRGRIILECIFKKLIGRH